MLYLGTAYFPSFAYAQKYYEPYGYDFSNIIQMFEDGEIFIGEPKLTEEQIQKGCKIGLIDNNLRYCIIEPENSTPHVDKALSDMIEDGWLERGTLDHVDEF